jgi:hypothetical protein
MRYRALDENGDYTFGRGAGNFLVNSPDTVRQSIQTRLGLLQGEWYLNQQSGTPWLQQILVKGAVSKVYDLAIQTRILQTQGVKSIITYSSTADPVHRSLAVSALVQTIYSVDPINVDVTLGGSA